jgi:glutathione S-transferase
MLDALHGIWREAQEHLAWLDKLLERRQFVACGVTLGHISFIPPLAILEPAGFEIPERFKNLNAWWMGTKSRPSFAASWPPAEGSALRRC